MSYRGTGRASVDAEHPVAFALCDRCGAWRNRDELTWQFDYRGNALSNLRILVCSERSRCNDAPQEGLRPVIIPPDPIPVKDPRIEFFAYSEDPNNTGITKEQLLQQLADNDGGT